MLHKLTTVQVGNRIYPIYECVNLELSDKTENSQTLSDESYDYIKDKFNSPEPEILGTVDFREASIFIYAKLSFRQKVAVLAHELAHAYLHQMVTSQNEAQASFLSSGLLPLAKAVLSTTTDQPARNAND